MSKISGKDTKTEILVRKYLYSNGIRYRKNDKRYPGTPDIVIPKAKTIIFIHGCFWHGHKGCAKAKLPETRNDFWSDKINKNIQRDKRNIKELKEDSWNVIEIWQCELRTKDMRELRLSELVNQIKSIHKL